MQDKYKPIICIDFDGVIHSYASGWQGVDVIPDPPVPGAFEALRNYLEFFSVNIYSSRSQSVAGINAMLDWFSRNGFDDVDKLIFPTKKPAAFLTIDDRCICFDGNWPGVEDIKNFKPWNKK